MGCFISSLLHSFHQDHHHFAGNIVLSDGSFQELSQPMAAAELMLENPGRYVVEFSPKSTTKLLLPLPADYRLDPSKVYLMIPMARGKANGVSVEEARKIVTVARAKKIRGIGVDDVMREFGEFMRVQGEEAVKEDEEEDNTGILMEGWFSEKAEMLRRQYSSNKGWKPSLGTIEERNFEKKLPHWLF